MRHCIYQSVVVLAMTLGAGCSQKPANVDTGAATEDSKQTSNDIYGRWEIEEVRLNDSVDVRPSETVPDRIQHAIFSRTGEYAFNTNCNTIQGAFTIDGDSIKLYDGMKTEMACDNEEVETLLCQLLPHIATLDIENDSVARLNSEAGGYILLRRGENPGQK